MNRIYKSIFNEQTGTYVAVSENTKNKGKKGNKVLAATALSTALGFGAMGSAQAQLVSACAGVSLPPSVVTEIVGDVLVPVVGPLENVLNGLLGILVPDVDLGLDDALANAAAGKPIKLDVLTGFLDANGDPTVIGENDDCNLTADSLNLTDPAGIAIGGNTITGLGSDAAGAAAVSSAADFTSIAFGNFSEATASKAIAFGEAAKATAEGALALGAGANASALNAIALGTDSIADAANTLSVGSAGNERKITNVADGIIDENSTDAVTGGQLHTLTEVVKALDGGTTGSNLIAQATNTAPILVGAITGGTEVNFTNGENKARTLTGIANGDVAADSTDAVTGDQLFSTNVNLDATKVNLDSTLAALGGGAEVDPVTGTVTPPTYELDDGANTSTIVPFNTVGGALENLDGRVTSNTGRITTIEGDINDITTDLGDLTANAVQYDGADKSIVTLGGTGGTIISNVIAGAVNAASTEAINGAQLHAGNLSIANALGGDAEVDSDGKVTAPSYAVDATVSAFNNVGDALGNLAGRVAGNEISITNIEGDITSIINGEVGIVKQDATTRNITVGGETDGTLVDIAGTEGARKLTGLSNGTVDAGSSDAVTGDQLFSTNTDLATTKANLDSTLAALGGGAEVDPVTGTVTAPDYVLDDGTNTATTVSLNTVGGALENLDGRVTSNTGRITTIEGDINDITTDLGDLTSNAVQYDGADKSIVTLGGTGGTTISNVKAGAVNAASTEAINGAQLYRSTSDLADALGGNAIVDANGNLTNVGYTFISGPQSSVGQALGNLDGRVDANTTNITNLMNGAAGLVQQTDPTAEITVGAGTGGTVVNFTNNTGDLRTLTGIAEGDLSDSSTDAVTGKQLHATNEVVKDLGDTVQEHTSVLNQHTNQIFNINQQLGNLNENAVMYDAGSNKAQITLGGAGGTIISNVKAGAVNAASTEAVNGAQLHSTNIDLATALTALNAGVDPVTGAATKPDYVLDDGTNTGTTTTVNTVGEAFSNLDGRVTSNTSRITNIEGDITEIRGDITNIEGDITNIKNGTAGIVKYDAVADKITVGSEVAGSSVDFTGTAGARKLTGIADGELSATSSDAVTGKQLHATNQQVKASGQFTANALGGGAEAKDDGTFVNPLYALQEIQQDGSKVTKEFRNVGGALTSLNTSVNSLQDQVNSAGIGLVQQDTTTRVISVGGDTDGTVVNVAGTEGPRVISGVAAGTGPTDAVNVQQAQEMISGATTALRGEIRRAEKRADAGTAAATAVATLGQAYQPGQSAFSMGGGTWRGETGYAMGVSTVSENGKWLLKGAVSGSGRGGAGGGASVTYLW